MWCKICTNSVSLWRQILRKSVPVKMHLMHHICTKLITVNANAKKTITVKMHLIPNMYKTVILKANAKEIITLKMHLMHHICTKSLLWRQMLRKSSLWTCMCACQICIKSLLWMQMLRKLLLENAFDTKICTNTITFKVNAEEIMEC